MAAYANSSSKAGEHGKYITSALEQISVSVTGMFDNKDFGPPSALRSPFPTFPTRETLSHTNAHIFQSCINLAYEDWRIVKDALERWGSEAQKTEWAAGYHVNSLTWTTDQNYGASAEDLTVHHAELGVRVYIAKINKAIVVAFQGTSPFQVADWYTDWDIYADSESGKFGRIHPGFRTALGLDKDLKPLPSVRTTLTVLNGVKRCAFSELPLSLSEILQNKLVSLVKDDADARIYVVGHSMGSALAAIFATALDMNTSERSNTPKAQGVLTIGQPRFGDYKFATTVSEKLGSSPRCPNYIRVANCDDIVPAMPPSGSQDPAPSSFQHAGQLMYISPFGKTTPQLEQPSITVGRVFLISILSAIQTTRAWPSQYIRGLDAPRPEYPSFLLVLAKWSVLLFCGLPHGMVQHIPANYSQAINPSLASDWTLKVENCSNTQPPTCTLYQNKYGLL